jgi:hypothetical protein
MVEPRQSAMQRIQVGLVGLVVVLLFVSLANMVLDRVADGSSVSEDPATANTGSTLPDEPLAELGVTPVAADEAAPPSQSNPPATNNAGQIEDGQRR